MKRFDMLYILLFWWLSFEPVGLQAGDRAPDFSATDQNGNEITLSEVLQDHQVVLTFFRGSWCRYCMKQMKDYQDSIAMYAGKKAIIIAVTPQKSEGIQKAAEISKATFPIVHDTDLRIMEAYDVISKEKVSDYRSNFAHLEEDHSRKFLPVPAAYVIDQQSIIKYVYFDPNYRIRVSNEILLEAL